MFHGIFVNIKVIEEAQKARSKEFKRLKSAHPRKISQKANTENAFRTETCIVRSFGFVCKL